MGVQLYSEATFIDETKQNFSPSQKKKLEMENRFISVVIINVLIVLLSLTLKLKVKEFTSCISSTTCSSLVSSRSTGTWWKWYWLQRRCCGRRPGVWERLTGHTSTADTTSGTAVLPEEVKLLVGDIQEVNSF